MKLYRAKHDFIFSEGFPIYRGREYRESDKVYKEDRRTCKEIPYRWVDFNLVLNFNPSLFTEIHQTFMIADGTKEKGKRIIEKLERFGGLNDRGFTGWATTYPIYYINEQGNIRAADATPNYCENVDEPVIKEGEFPRLMRFKGEVVEVFGLYPTKDKDNYTITLKLDSFTDLEELTDNELKAMELEKKIGELSEQLKQLRTK